MTGRRRTERAARAAAMAGLALLAAACGAGASETSVRGSGALAFSRCMRSHGLPGWPDPNSTGVTPKESLQQLGVSSSRLLSAQTSCRSLLPKGGRAPDQAEQQQVRADSLRFSECVRAHGVANFPDPAHTGRIPDPATVGIDQGSPRFEAANQACRRYRPPYIPSNSAYDAWARTHTGGS